MALVMVSAGGLADSRLHNVRIGTLAAVSGTLALIGLLGHAEGWQPASRAVSMTRRAFLVGDLALVTGIVVVLRSVGELDLRNTADAAAVLSDSEISLFGACGRSPP